MARIRTIKPEFFTSYSTACLPIEARFLLIGLFTEADDQGRMVDSPKRLSGAIFPHDEKVTPAKVDKWLSAIADGGTILRYEVEGLRYICFPKWEEHQRISHAAQEKLPPPSGGSPEILPGEGKGREGNKTPQPPTGGGRDLRPSRANGTAPRQLAAQAEADERTDQAVVLGRELADSAEALPQALAKITRTFPTDPVAVALAERIYREAASA